VLKNLWERLWSYIREPRRRPARLTTHTKLVLTATAILLTGGAGFIYFSELALNGGQPWSGEALPAVFLSVTARTAGFNTTPTELLAPVTVAAVILLMFIGGGPAGTAGGIKVSTLAIAFLNTLRILRGAGGELVAFGRRIPDAFANRAFAIVLLAAVWVSLTTLALLALMPEEAPLDVLFESVSAFATVGLSRGITADLPAVAKLIMVASKPRCWRSATCRSLA
jgi:trk system potassium uptake protein